MHYLSQANPIRQPKDLVTCILNNVVYHDEQIILLNKPPGVMVLGRNNSEQTFLFIAILVFRLDETWDRKTAQVTNEDHDEDEQEQSNVTNSNPCTIQYHMPQFRSALKWEHFFPCIRTPK